MANHIYVLIGLPASGKSTFCNSIEDAKVFSSDEIRAELFGDEKVQGDPKQVFSLLRERLIDAVKAGNDAIVDATNMTVWERKSYIDIAKEHGAVPVAIKFTTPVEECKRRNTKRDRIVPDFVYDKMIAKYEEPTLEEGFSEIREIC